MESISLKLQLLNCPEKLYPEVYKHFVVLNMTSLKELSDTLSYLTEEGLIEPKVGEILVKPSDFVIFGNSLDEIKRIVNSYKELGEIAALKEDLSRINVKSAIDNIIYLRNINEPYKTFDGKYSVLPFSHRKFKNKYGIVNNKEEDINEEVDMELFDRFESLINISSDILDRLYGFSDVSVAIKSNIAKLIAGGLESDAMVLYSAISSAYDLPLEETNRLKDIISDALDYSYVENNNMGRAA